MVFFAQVRMIMTKWHGGKGSSRRPENTKKYEDNYEAIFGKKKKKKQDDKQSN